jgi:hypothetical protein
LLCWQGQPKANGADTNVPARFELSEDELDHDNDLLSSDDLDGYDMASICLTLSHI